MREATAPIQSLVKLQSWFLSLRWKTCLPQNCSLGCGACSEGPALGQNTCYWIWGRRVIGISGSLIWSETLMKLIFNPFGEFRWSLEGPVSQIHSTHLLVGAPGIFQIFKVCSDAKERVGCGKQREATAPIKSLVKLQPWFLSLRWKTCLRQNCSLGFSACTEGPAFEQNTDDDIEYTEWKVNKCHPFNSRRGRLKGPKYVYTIWGLNLIVSSEKGVPCSVLFTSYCL